MNRRFWNPDPERLRINHAYWDLQNALWCLQLGDVLEAGRLFREVMHAIVIEPDPNSQEYKDGERKPEIPLDEQEETESAKGTIDGPTAAERDEEGYLIR